MREGEKGNEKVRGEKNIFEIGKMRVKREKGELKSDNYE